MQQWQYAYDPFGRRISKERTDKGSLHSTDPKRTVFIWDGSRIVQEYNYKGVYTYFYTDQDSYEPLAHVFLNKKDEKLYLSYYHTDQIGIPREQTDQFGNLLWAGEYDAWGQLTREEKIYPNAHQPFRLQNQYFDAETGLHYNLFRYYAPECGRFVSQDPIKLAGGDNLYFFADNVQDWIDPLGLCRYGRKKNGECGKKRGPKTKAEGGLHNDMIDAFAAEVKRCHGEIISGGGDTETVIPIPSYRGRVKSARRPDIEYQIGKIKYFGNVGKSHKQPIKREREAIADLQAALKNKKGYSKKVIFWSYTNSKCNKKLCP